MSAAIILRSPKKLREGKSFQSCVICQSVHRGGGSSRDSCRLVQTRNLFEDRHPSPLLTQGYLGLSPLPDMFKLVHLGTPTRIHYPYGDPFGSAPPPDMFKFVHLGKAPWPHQRTCSHMGKRVVGLRRKGILITKVNQSMKLTRTETAWGDTLTSRISQIVTFLINLDRFELVFLTLGTISKG